jgi:hypothetical protein
MKNWSVSKRREPGDKRRCIKYHKTEDLTNTAAKA